MSWMSEEPPGLSRRVRFKRTRTKVNHSDLSRVSIGPSDPAWLNPAARLGLSFVQFFVEALPDADEVGKAIDGLGDGGSGPALVAGTLGVPGNQGGGEAAAR